MNPTITISDTGGLTELGKATFLPAMAAAAGAMFGMTFESKSPVPVLLLAAIGAAVGSAIANAPPKLDNTSFVPAK